MVEEPPKLAAVPRLTAPSSCVSCGICAFYCPMSCITIAAPEAAEVPA
jgi:NAD-dependent dihydropyrimidine dehydrogenase PreA subunit